jgi:hypothetical protein
MGRYSTWAASTTSARRRQPSTRRRGGCGARTRTADDQEHNGSFDDEHEAARAVDTAARRLRGDDAHGGLAGRPGRQLRLNFPSDSEVKRAQERGALLTEENKTAAVAASQRQGPSKFVGVGWDKKSRKWRATI